MPTILTAFGVLVAYNAIAKSKAADTLNFYPQKVQDITFDGATPVMVVGLAVQNTSGQQFVIHSIAGNLYCNNYLVGNLSYFSPQTIQPNSSGLLLLNIRLSLIGIVNDILQAFQDQNTTQNVLLQGYVNVDNFNVPLKVTYKVGL